MEQVEAGEVRSCRKLNEAEILYPGTNLRLVYRPIMSSVSPEDRISETVGMKEEAVTSILESVP